MRESHSYELAFNRVESLPQPERAGGHAAIFVAACRVAYALRKKLRRQLPLIHHQNRSLNDVLLFENPDAGQWRALAKKLNWAAPPNYEAPSE